MTRTLVEEARAVLAVWDDPDTDSEDVVAAIERLRQACDPLNADLIQAVEMDPSHHYLLCVWVRQYANNAVVDRIRAGMVALADQIENSGRRIVPAVLGPDVERIELVGFDVAAETADASADAAVAVGEAGASRSQVAAG